MLSQRPTSDTRTLTAVPAPPSLDCTIRVEGDVVTVAPIGELDLATAPLLESAMSSQRDLGIDTLVVDLRGVTFIDSSGVHLLLRWARETALRNHRFRVIPGSERVQLVFAIAGVLEALGLDP